MATRFDPSVRSLIARLERELARGPIVPEHTAETAAIGGWNKLGHELERFLRALVDELAPHADAVKVAEARSRLEDKITLGTLEDVARDLGAGLPRSKRVIDPVARRVLDDLQSGPRSRLHRLVELRNVAAHGGKQKLTVAGVRGDLEAAITLLTG
jgi:hypothetical protein